MPTGTGRGCAQFFLAVLDIGQNQRNIGQSGFGFSAATEIGIDRVHQGIAVFF